jgi:hypothetical protein
MTVASPDPYRFLAQPFLDHYGLLRGEAIAALRSLAAEGDPVTAAVKGLDAEAAQWGILPPLGGTDNDEDDVTAESFAAEMAASFAVGDDGTHTFDLWRSRFLSASADELNGIKVVTADGELRLYKNRPWID